ncbi:phosphate acyltransferase [Treponema primitia]|uniref:phosphate acyltransferase n=1 Tax=Treponema primitia TaxID=88058 RepID=UPI0002555391|nr:phosphate acyltransferase [Treponema primitia]
MIKSTQEIIDRAIKSAAGGKEKILVIAAAHDENVLQAAAAAAHQGIVKPVLVGNAEKIADILEEIGEKSTDYWIEHAADNTNAAAKAVSLVRSGRADFLMKGLLSTAELMRAVIDRETGLRTGKVISHVMLYETAAYPKILAVTDGGMNTYPDLEKKIAIVTNAAEMFKVLGYDRIVAACVCGAESVDPKIQSTVDAQALSRMTSQWDTYNLKVLGPVGLDLAISENACRHKGYDDPDGGNADILLMPNYEVGNGIGKALTYFAGARSAGIILGAKVPIVLVSRSDEAETKLSSIALGCLLSG